MFGLWSDISRMVFTLIKVTLCDCYSPSLSRESLQVLDINIFLKYLPLTQRLVVLLSIRFKLHYFTISGRLFWVRKFQFTSRFQLVISSWKLHIEAESLRLLLELAGCFKGLPHYSNHYSVTWIPKAIPDDCERFSSSQVMKCNRILSVFHPH